MVLHAMPDCQGHYQALLEESLPYIKAGLMAHQPDLRCLGLDFAGSSEDEIREWARTADVLILLVSVHFAFDPFCQELMDELPLLRKRRGQQQMILQFRAFSYEDSFPNLLEIPRYPESGTSLEEQGPQLSKCLNGFSQMLKAALEGKSPQAKPPTDPIVIRQQHATLLKALDRLNYAQQPRHFNQKALFQQEPIPSAFLVHGHLRPLGTDWLLAKLMEKLPSQRTWILQTSVERADFNIEDNGFMSEVAERLGLSKQADYGAIKDKLLQFLKSTPLTLVLRFDGMKEMLASTILTAFEEFKQQFWQPLLQEWKANSQSFASKLIVFFVANEPLDHNPHFLDFQQAGSEGMVRLPMVDAFDAGLLENWLDDHGDLLLQLPYNQPEALLKMDSRAAKINEILSKSRDGFPELVLQHLCKECACDFEQVLKMRSIYENGN